jgi:hypothetical protein
MGCEKTAWSDLMSFLSSFPAYPRCKLCIQLVHVALYSTYNLSPKKNRAVIYKDTPIKS